MAEARPALSYFTRSLPTVVLVAGIGYALNSLIYIVVARFLDPENFGDLKVAASTMLVAAVVVALGGGRAASRFLGRRLSGCSVAGGYIRFYAVAILVLSASLAVVIWTIAVLDPDGLPEDIHGQHPVSFVVLLVPVWAGLDLLSQLFMITRRPVLGALPARFVFPALALAAIGVAYAVGWRMSDVAFVLMLTVAGWLTLLVFSLVLAISERSPAVSESGHHDEPIRNTGPRDWLRLSLPMMGAALLVIVATEAPLFAMALLGDRAEVGLFGAAATLIQSYIIIVTCQRQVYGPALPAALAGDGDAAVRLHRHSLVTGVMMVLPLTLVMVAAANPLLGLFGPEFAAARPALWVLLVGAVAMSMTALLTRWLDYAGHARLVVTIEALSVGAIALGSLLLIPAFGLLGAAVAFSATLTVKALVLAVLARRRLGLPILALSLGPAAEAGPP